MSLTFFYPA